MKQITNYLLVLLIAAGFFWACDNEPEPQPNNSNQQQGDLSADDSLKYFIHNVMDYSKWYFWYEEMPEVDPANVSSAQKYFDTLLYKEKDTWSFITDLETYQQHYQEGKYKGLGVRLKFDAEQNLRVAFVYNDSPMGRKGVTRGYKIQSINGVSAQEIYNNGLGSALKETGNTITLENLQGETETITVDMEEVGEASVLKDSIYHRGDKTIGYFVFQNFIEPAQPALENLFSRFKEEGVTDLVVDLRYNGGGMLSIAGQLANLIAGNKAGGSLFYKRLHNQHHREADSKEILYFEARANSLDLNNVLFITTGATASASEAVINGLDISALEGKVNLKLLGTPTHGKPVGMYVFSTNANDIPIGKVVAPVTFKGVNADGKGEYFGGMEVDARRYDDLNKRFGNTEENCLYEALYYLENGEFSQPTKVVKVEKPRIKLEGMRMEIGAF